MSEIRDVNQLITLTLNGSTAYPRYFDSMTATVTIEESHMDEVVITEHPVEVGAQISDHAFKRPAELTVRCGWNGNNGETVQQIYQQLLSLQQALQTIAVSTGKRQYQNMLVAGLTCITDEKSENVLLVQVRFREIITVSTQNVSSPTLVSSGTPVPSGATGTQAIPQDTSGITDTGNQVLQAPTTLNPSNVPFLVPGTNQTLQ